MSERNRLWTRTSQQGERPRQEFFQSHVSRNDRKTEEEMGLDMISNSGNMEESNEDNTKMTKQKDGMYKGMT
jgi:ribose 1,5-bisphosphokinase PhnN